MHTNVFSHVCLPTLIRFLLSNKGTLSDFDFKNQFSNQILISIFVFQFRFQNWFWILILKIVLSPLAVNDILTYVPKHVNDFLILFWKSFRYHFIYIICSYHFYLVIHFCITLSDSDSERVKYFSLTFMLLLLLL